MASAAMEKTSSDLWPGDGGSGTGGCRILAMDWFPPKQEPVFVFGLEPLRSLGGFQNQIFIVCALKILLGMFYGPCGCVLSWGVLIFWGSYFGFLLFTRSSGSY